MKKEMLGEIIETKDELNFYLYPQKDLSPIEKILSSNILLVGQTGSGISRFLQSLINYLKGIKLEENDRYYLFNEKLPNNHEYSIYNIKSTKIYNIPLRLIDIQGFSDMNHKIIYEEFGKIIKDLMSNKIDTLNSVFLFFKSSDIREPSYINPILYTILNIFGSNFKKNIIIIFTFANDFKIISDYNIITKITNKNSPLNEFLGNNIHYFQFENSVYFNSMRDNLSDIYNKNNENFEKLLSYVLTLEPYSINFAKQIIKERFIIANKIINLSNELSDNIMKFNILIKNRYTIQNLKNELEIIGDSPYKQIKIVKQIKEYYNENYKENCNKGLYVFYCNSCNKICHYNCLGPNEDLDENKCKIIKFGQICSYCNCHYQKHEYRDNTIKTKIYEKTVNIETWKNDDKSLIDKNEKISKKEIINKEIEKGENKLKLLDEKICIILKDIINIICSIIKFFKIFKEMGVKIDDNYEFDYFKKILNEIIIEDKTKNIIYKIVNNFELIRLNDEEKEKFIKNIQKLLIN